MENRIDAQITDETLAEIMAAFALIRSKMPFLISVSREQKKRILRLADGRLPFTEDALKFARDEVTLNPDPLLLTNAEEDLALFKSLSKIMHDIESLKEMVSDTSLVAGSEAYKMARMIYKKAEFNKSMGRPGSDTYYDELGKLYKAQGNRTKRKHAE